MSFCSDASPNVRSPTTSPRWLAAIAEASTSAAPEVVVSTSTETGFLHMTCLGSAENTCVETVWPRRVANVPLGMKRRDRKSTRLNSSHRCISYAVFCLKKKKKKRTNRKQHK